MSIGWKGTDASYPLTPYQALIAPLSAANLTGIGIGEALPLNPTADQVRDILKKDYGIIDLSDTEVAQIQAAKASKAAMDKIVGPMISTRSIIGWTTIGHNGEDLPFYAYGPTRPTGLIENTYIAMICAQNLNINLAKVENRLFVEAAQAFSAIGATVTMDKSDPTNWVLVVMKNGQELARLPLSKNIITIGTNTYDMEGRTIYAPITGKTYVPQQAVTLVARICWN
jgi:alkaline phosphatase